MGLLFAFIEMVIMAIASYIHNTDMIIFHGFAMVFFMLLESYDGKKR